MSSPPPPPTATETTTSATYNYDTYWCHECDMSILLSAAPPQTPLLHCPHCQDCILEHMDTFPPFGHHHQQPITNLYDPSIWAPPPDNNRPYLHRLIHHLANSAATVGVGEGGGGGNLYDPPNINPVSVRASRNTIESLKMITVSSDLVENCPICKEQFCVDAMGNELPCGHIFHNECIVPWLEMNNTCPLCRFRLVTKEDVLGEETYIGAMRLDELLDDGDDVDYENELRQLMRIDRGGVWNRNIEGGSSEGARMMFSPTQIGEAGTTVVVVDRANSVETVSSCPVWQTEGEREVGTGDVHNVVRV